MPMMRDSKTYTLYSRTLAQASDGNGDARETYTANGTVSMTVYPMSTKEASEVYGKVNGDMLIGLAKTAKVIGIGDKLTSEDNSYKVVGCTKYAVSAYQLDLWRA